jgi:DNA-binding NarL/FixJ family response regulator
MTSVRVFIVDDHEIVRRGITTILATTDDIAIIGEAATGRAAILRAPTVKPDVIIIGALDDIGGAVEVARELRTRHPPIAVLMLTTTDDDDAIMAAILAGAAGVVAKTINAVDLIAAVRSLAAGRTLLDARGITALLERVRNAVAPTSRFDDLTTGERKVLECLGEGLANRQIAVRLFISDKTVKNLVSRVLAKLGVKSRTQAALAIQHEQESHS